MGPMWVHMSGCPCQHLAFPSLSSLSHFYARRTLADGRGEAREEAGARRDRHRTRKAARASEEATSAGERGNREAAAAGEHGCGWGAMALTTPRCLASSLAVAMGGRSIEAGEQRGGGHGGRDRADGRGPKSLSCSASLTAASRTSPPLSHIPPSPAAAPALISAALPLPAMSTPPPAAGVPTAPTLLPSWLCSSTKV